VASDKQLKKELVHTLLMDQQLASKLRHKSSMSNDDDDSELLFKT